MASFKTSAAATALFSRAAGTLSNRLFGQKTEKTNGERVTEHPLAGGCAFVWGGISNSLHTYTMSWSAMALP